MRLYDVEDKAQDLIDSGQVSDKPISTFGDRERKFNSKFDGLKV
jgi:hypothetical protein